MPMQLAMRPNPGKLVLRRKLVLVIEAIAEVSQCSFLQQPLERLDIRNALPDPKLHEEVRLKDRELREDGVLVILVETFEIGLELRIAQRIQRQFFERALFRLIDSKDVLQLNLTPQPNMHIIAKQQTPTAYRDDI